MSKNFSDSYNGNTQVKKDGVVHQFTNEQLEEYARCRESSTYFIKNYVKIINLNKGLTKFTLYPYQEKMVNHFEKNRFSIVKACRQSGKSVTAIAYLLWYVLFHPTKKVGILANKGATAREMLGRLTLMLENVPFFLQPGCKTLNKGSIEFSNKSSIVATSTSASSVRGLSLNCIMLDEFAFVNDAATFYTSTYPVITSGDDTKVIITSTPNGIGNQFYKMWQAAVTKVSEYKPFEIRWSDVPGRDEEWKRQTIANTSELQFAQEFECDFLGSSDTLINAACLLSLTAYDPKEIINDVRYYSAPEEGKQYIMTVDVSKGRGQDYSTFTVIDANVAPFKQVAVFRNNNISPLLYPDIIVRVAKFYNDALVIIENNDAGHVVCNGVYHEYEYENTFVESAVKSMGVGCTMTKRVKRIGCSNLKDLLESGKLEICDADTITELAGFEAKGSSYEAAGNGFDDLVMNLVMFAWFACTDMFSEQSSVDLKNLLFSERLREMENDLVPFGIMPEQDDTPPSMKIYVDMIDEQLEWNNL